MYLNVCVWCGVVLCVCVSVCLYVCVRMCLTVDRDEAIQTQQFGRSQCGEWLCCLRNQSFFSTKIIVSFRALRSHSAEFVH